MIGVTTIENVLQGIGSSLEDSSGGTSSIRVAMFLWMMVLCFGVAWIVYKTTAFPNLPDPIVYITALCISGKVGQKWIELNNPSLPASAIPPETVTQPVVSSN